METSILNSMKKMLGISPEYIHFDVDIILSINTIFMTLNQLGVGPSVGFSITDSSQVWTDFIGNRKDLEAIKSYTYLRLRLLFDPPTNSFLVASIEKQIAELEWRLNAEAEGGPDYGSSG